MTRLLYLPDDNTLIQLDSPLKPEDLIQSIEKNLWTPPGLEGGRSPGRLQAFRAGSAVVVCPSVHGKSGAVRRRGGSPALSRRQQEVLQALAEGLTSRQIAARLKLYPGTVDLHIRAIKARLGANNRTESVSRAAALGLIDPEGSR
ncbi:MAG: response regulator transcription factor [Anaerolineaceae bacterium]|nr:response regulator transcription factor [Anaerolineaceae bacterium]